MFQWCCYPGRNLLQCKSRCCCYNRTLCYRSHGVTSDTLCLLALISYLLGLVTINGTSSVAHKNKNIYSAWHFPGNTACQLWWVVSLVSVFRKLEEMSSSSFWRSDFFGCFCNCLQASELKHSFHWLSWWLVAFSRLSSLEGHCINTWTCCHWCESGMKFLT